MSIQIYAIIGESASGKDSVAMELRKNNKYHFIVSCTTRPPREYEINGIDYYFISTEKFVEQVLSEEMLEASDFNNWFYGTPISSLDRDKINIGVFNPEGIENLIRNKDLKVTIFKLCASDKTRLMRALEREESPNCAEICRRFLADQKDFADLDFDYIELDSEHLSVEQLAAAIDNFNGAWTK